MKWKVMIFVLLFAAASFQAFGSSDVAISACINVACIAVVAGFLYWLKLPAASIVFLATAPIASNSYLFGGVGTETQGKLLIVSLAIASFLYFTDARRKMFPKGIAATLSVGAIFTVFCLITATLTGRATNNALPIVLLMCIISIEMIVRRALRSALAFRG